MPGHAVWRTLAGLARPHPASQSVSRALNNSLLRNKVKAYPVPITLAQALP